MNALAGTTIRHAPSRRFRLRRATADAHARLEALMGAGQEPAGLFRPLSNYRRYLRAMHAVRRALERELDDSGAARLYPRWPSRRIAGALDADLQDLGHDPGDDPGAEASSACEPASRPRLRTCEILGRLYVLEGSAVGARLLARAADWAGLSGGFGARHLHMQASDTGAWAEFVALLDGAALSPGQDAACERTAAETFELFAAAFTGARPEAGWRS